MKVTISPYRRFHRQGHLHDTDHAMTPHFGAAEMQEMVDSGLISIQSHTYDMHQWLPFEDGNDRVRETPAAARRKRCGL